MMGLGRYCAVFDIAVSEGALPPHTPPGYFDQEESTKI